MRMPAPRSYNCVLCSKRTKEGLRRKLVGDKNKALRRFLKRKFFIEDNKFSEYAVICCKCKQMCYKEMHKNDKSTTLHDQTEKQTLADPDYVPPTKYQRQSTCQSPLSISLRIPSAGGSHSTCFVCKRRGPKLVTVPTSAIHQLFIEKFLILPTGSRCCPGHLSSDLFLQESMEKISETRSNTLFNRSNIIQLLSQIRDIALKNSNRRVDFDTEISLSDSDIYNLTGICKSSFDELCSIIQCSKMRESKTRTIRTSVGVLLTKLKSGMSNKLISTIFNMGKDSIRRCITSARKYLMESFVPFNLGFQHIRRDSIINDHTSLIARSLFGGGMNPAMLVVDGTYIYIEKSIDYKFQRRCYSMHKHRPLVKPMVFVSTTGYIVSVIGPYYSDIKNNDAKILNHIIHNNLEEIKEWLNDEDLLIVDRGFRDSIDLLSELGINTEMPSFLQKGENQLSVEESNLTRLVTKIRWIVESVNGRIKLWKYLDKIIPNSQIPHIGDYVKIVCAIMNKFWTPVNNVNSENDQQLAAKMLYLSKQKNTLQERIINEGLDKRPSQWTKVDATDSATNFPKLSEEDIRNMTLGVYQMKMSKSYTKEHLDSDGKYEMLICNHDEYLLCAKLQSRHTSSRSYKLWICYDDCSIRSWYCKCKSGARVVGTCSHVTSLVWFLGLGRYIEKLFHNNRDWSKYLLDAQNIPEPESIEDSDGEADVVEE